MCGRYALTTPADVLAQLLQVTAGALVTAGAERWPARYNIAPTQLAPVVRRRRGEPERRLDVLQWGLVPFWAEDPKVGGQMINARSETAATRRAYRKAFAHRRCLVPADGFFEWRKVGRRKQPYFIHRVDDRPLVFAGLWERWRRDEHVIESFSILTRDASDAVRDLHDRMPVMLEPESWADWLDPDLTDPAVVETVMERGAEVELALRPVSTRVNRPEHDDPEILEATEPLEEPPEPAGEQGTLFD